MLQELPYGDLSAVVAVAVDDTGQPAVDRVVQPDPALADELEQHHRHERLRGAADPEVPVDRHGRAGFQVGHPAAGCGHSVPVADQALRPGHAEAVQIVEAVL